MTDESLLQNSSIPGAGILTDSSTPKLRKRIWIFVIATGFIAFTVHMIILILRLVSVPVIIEVAYRGDPFEFPDVTLCHTGPYSMIRTNRHADIPIQIDHELARTGAEVVAGIKNFWKTLVPEFRGLVFNKYTRKDNIVARNTLYQYGLRHGFGHDAHEVVIGCEFKGEPCNFYNFSTIQVPNYLNCFTFSPRTDKQRYTVRPGEEQGLSLIIMDADRRNIMTEMETLDFIRGLKVFVHSPGTYPEMETFEVAQVGKFTKISLHMTCNHRISRTVAPCLEKTKQMTICADASPTTCRSFEYSAELCQEVDMQEQVFEKCGCLSEELSVPEKYVDERFCHAINSSYISKDYKRDDVNESIIIVNKNIQLSLIPAILSNTFTDYGCHMKAMESLSDIRSRQNCIIPCSSKSYSTYTSIFDWPTNARYAREPLKHYGSETFALAKESNLNTRLLETKILNNTLKSTNLLRERFLRLLVYPKFGHSVRMEETLAYPWSAFLSDIGGILGLWIGFSMITIIEVIEWVVLRIAACKPAGDGKKEGKEGKKKNKNRAGDAPGDVNLNTRLNQADGSNGQVDAV